MRAVCVEVGKGGGGVQGGGERVRERECLCSGGGESLVNAPPTPPPPPPARLLLQDSCFRGDGRDKEVLEARPHFGMCASTGEGMCACVLRMCALRVCFFFCPQFFFVFFKGGVEGTPSIPERGRGSAGAITVSEARVPRAPDPSPRGYFYLPTPGWICLLFTAEGCGRRRRPLTTTPPHRHSNPFTG